MSYENPARWILARPNQNFAFRPFMFSLEKDEEQSPWRLEPRTAQIVTVDTAHWPSRQFYFKYYGDFLIYNTNYAFDG